MHGICSLSLKWLLDQNGWQLCALVHVKQDRFHMNFTAQVHVKRNDTVAHELSHIALGLSGD
jgi:hypothetical protein